MKTLILRFDNIGNSYVKNSKNETYFDNQTGTVVAHLSFNGSAIQDSGVSAPYTLDYLRLSKWNNEESIWEELEVVFNAYSDIDYSGGS